MQVLRFATMVGGMMALIVGGLLMGADATAKSRTDAPSVAFVREQLEGGSAAGVDRAAGTLVLASAGSPGLTPGIYADPHQPGVTSSYDSGTWTGEWVATPFAFEELIASWSAATPQGSWLKVEMEARGSGRQTKAYILGIWAAGDADIRRTSVAAQGMRTASSPSIRSSAVRRPHRSTATGCA